MDSNGKHGNSPLEIFFIPLLARGHMIPMLGLANFLADAGIRATIVTTPKNASFLRSAAQPGLHLSILTVPFPDVGLPPGCETAFDLPPGVDKMKIFQAAQLLRHPIELLLREHCPDCIVGDITVPWIADVAESLDIPHIQFAVNAFADVIINNLAREMTEADESVPGLPHRIEMKKSELPEIFSVMHEVNMANRAKSAGVVFNTFYELEPDYVELVKGYSGGVPIWCAGPYHLLRNINNNSCNNNEKNWDKYKKWLDGRDPDSVLYVNFGSECCFGGDQLAEIAHGLVVTEWVPQAEILAHVAVGGYVVHCGWNSSIEAIAAGLPVITWPLQADQFMNERVFVEVNGTGVRVSESVEQMGFGEAVEDGGGDTWGRREKYLLTSRPFNGRREKFGVI